MVFITGRVHPGETPSSHILHGLRVFQTTIPSVLFEYRSSIKLAGLMEFLCSNDARAIKMRSECCFKIVPMLNVDGVVLGNYRLLYPATGLQQPRLL